MPPTRKHPPLPGSCVTCRRCGSSKTKVAKYAGWSRRDAKHRRVRICESCGKKFRTVQPPEEFAGFVRAVA